MPDPLHDFVDRHRPGQIVTGTVASRHDFGVFVDLDGEPPERPAGFIRIPDLSWAVVPVAGIVEVGQRITGQVVVADPDRRQVVVSLKALQPAPDVH